MTTPSCALWNVAPVSASVADERTTDMMEQWVWTAPLCGGGLESGNGVLSDGFELKKWSPPARERALDSER